VEDRAQKRKKSERSERCEVWKGLRPGLFRLPIFFSRHCLSRCLSTNCYEYVAEARKIDVQLSLLLLCKTGAHYPRWAPRKALTANGCFYKRRIQAHLLASDQTTLVIVGLRAVCIILALVHSRVGSTIRDFREVGTFNAFHWPCCKNLEKTDYSEMKPNWPSFVGTWTSTHSVFFIRTFFTRTLRLKLTQILTTY